LEGLEVSEVNLSRAIENKDKRMDSDFWTKEPKKNPKLHYKKIGDVLLSSQYGISIAMNEDGIGYPIYRMNEIHNMLCDLEVDKCADITVSEFEKFELKDKDVLFNRTNSFEWVGRTGIYYQNDEIKRTFASYLVRFNPDENIILPEYLATFLNTKQGVWDVKRRARQSINQTNVNPEEVKEIEIPILDMNIQKKIRDNFEKANGKRIESQTLYRQAKELLLETIGLKDFQPSQTGTNIKSFKESFLATGRLDAEYYQPKYEEIENRIKSNPYSIIDNEFDILRGKSFQYINESKIGVIKTKQVIRSSSLNFDVDDYTSEFVLDTENLNLIEDKDIVFASMGRGSLGKASLFYSYLTDKKFTIDSTLKIFRLKPNAKVLPEYLFVWINSEICYELILRDEIGSTGITSIYESSIRNLLIPVVPREIQQQIAELIEKSFYFRRESERLLEEAKEMVEKEIENGEY
jgi:restriction endonuclease S subunit